MKSDDSDNYFDDLRKRLIEENDFLTKLIDTIPAKMYFHQEIQNKIAADKHLVMDKTADDLKRKFKTLPELSAKNKHKRSRLDASCQKSVSQVYGELNKVKTKKQRKPKGVSDPSVALTRAANIEELQKRLQEKIRMFQEKRHAANPVEKKRITQKLKKMKQKGNLTKQQNIDNKPKSKTVKEVSKETSKPVYNKEGKTIYSKFEFSEEGVGEMKKNEFSGKKYKQLLLKAEKKKEKIQNIVQNDPDKAKILLEQEKWKKALQKSEGIKVKDDPTLLKKSLKKQEKLKKKHAKLWKERIEQTETSKKIRQEKRSKNIQARKKEKLANKIKKAKKKGRVITGL